MSVKRRAPARCPYCEAPGKIRTSEEVTLMVRDIYIDCTDPECGHRWKAKLEFEHSIAVPLREKIKAYLPTRASRQRRELMLIEPPPAPA